MSLFFGLAGLSFFFLGWTLEKTEEERLCLLKEEQNKREQRWNKEDEDEQRICLLKEKRQIKFFE